MKTVFPDDLPVHEPLLLTLPYERLLEGILTYHLVTAEQLTRRFYSPGSLTLVKAYLKTLTEQGFVQHLLGRAPTEPFVYTLARKGLQYLREAGFDTRCYSRSGQEAEKGELFLKHTLCLNDFLITAALVEQVTPAFVLAEMRHERVLKRSPIVIWVPQEDSMVALRFVPDACLLFVSPAGSVPVLVELDRGTAAQTSFRRKLRCYIEFLRSHQYKETFDLEESITIAYATTGGVMRLAQLLVWTRRELAKTYEKGWLSDRFLFSALPGHMDAQTVFLSSIWYRAFDPEPVVLLEEH